MKFAGKLVSVAGILLAIWGVSLGVTNYSGRVWRGAGRFTVVKISEGIVVESIDPVNRSGTRLIVPSQTEISTLAGRGEWHPTALAVLENKYGGKWLAESVADFLGITVTGVYDRLGVWDKLAWWNLNRGVRWQVLNLDESQWMAERTTVDGERVLALTDGWNNKTGEIFYSIGLAQAGVEVRVFNATDAVGLAARMARRIESAGVRVIQVDESNEKVRGCWLIVASELEDNELVRWLDHQFGCEARWETGRGRIVDLVLGTDFAADYSESD